MTDPHRSPGQIAYEADCVDEPLYNDGRTRKSWSELPEHCKAEWEKNPTPRKRASR